MVAVRVHATGPTPDTRLDTVEVPRPEAGQVLVAIHAAAVNFVDVLTMRGQYQFRPEVPYVPGKGPAGVVVATGAGVGLRCGERVLAMAEYGGFAEYISLSESATYVLPTGMPFSFATVMAVAFDTAWVALRERARLVPGESVLILGAGGAVGQAAVQVARAMGARLVLAGVSSRSRCEDALSAGAHATVDVSLPEPREAIRRQVLEATDGSGVDVVIDPLGGDVFDGAVRSLAWRGRYVIVGFATGRIPTLRMNYPLLKNIEISGLQISDYRRRDPELMKVCFQDLFALWVEGRLKVPAVQEVPLRRWQEALAELERRGRRERLVLVPSAGPAL